MPKSLVAALCAGVAALLTAGPAQADPPTLHDVTYTVTSSTSVSADIYFRDVDPPTWADYSHNPYVFSPKVSVEVGPGRPWSLQVRLADPARWAMVSATGGRAAGDAGFRCELSVDGTVVSTSGGPKGALCAIRHW